jgi:hypothetical protein
MQPQEWSRLGRKYKKLPKWSWLVTNFVIKADEKPLTSAVKAGVTEKLSNVKDMIEPLLSGTESWCCWFERKMLTKAERGRLFEIYQHVQALLWRANAVTISAAERDFVDWLADVERRWNRLKPSLSAICSKLATGWERYKPEAKTVYHG